MTAWDPIAPNWGKIPPVKLLGTPAVAGTQLHLMTSAGSLRLTLHDCGLRLCNEQRARDYGMLVNEPVELPLALEATTDGFRDQHAVVARALFATQAQAAIVQRQTQGPCGRRQVQLRANHRGCAQHFCRGNSSPVRRNRVPGAHWPATT